MTQEDTRDITSLDRDLQYAVSSASTRKSGL